MAIAVAFLVFKRRRLPSVGAALLAGPLLSLGSLMADWLDGVGRRRAHCSCAALLVTPGLVTAGYVQVYRRHREGPPRALDLRVVRSAVPYRVEPPDLVGAQFFGRPETHANANWLADGYANFGYLGMVLASLVLIALLWTIDDATPGAADGVAPACSS